VTYDRLGLGIRVIMWHPGAGLSGLRVTGGPGPGPLLLVIGGSSTSSNVPVTP
jgi:hypothetical protein